MPIKTLIILNPFAASGRAAATWKDIEPTARQELGELSVAITQTPQDVTAHLRRAQDTGFSRVIAIGGDGTNQMVVNALMNLNQQSPPDQQTPPPMAFGTLPVGTGRDWARMLGIPFDPREAVGWLRDAQPIPVDIGHMEAESINQYFLNIAGAGVNGEIARRINSVSQKRPWTFLRKILETLLMYQPPMGQVYLDGQLWYEGGFFATIVANGQIFGHGLKIAPDASYTDGLFDIVLLRNVSRWTIIGALGKGYNGTHTTHRAVKMGQAKVVEVVSNTGNIPLDVDGECSNGSKIRFKNLPGALNMLIKK
jgi:diacylglycerol kinase (ATP)